MWLVLYLFLGLSTIAVVVSLASWILYVPIATRLFGVSPLLVPNSYPEIEDAEECEFKTADGLTLRGSYLATMHEPRNGMVVFCHELGGNRWGVVPYVDCLLEEGFDIFTFDYRSHGESERQPGYRPLPWLTEYDVADTKAAIAYLSSRPDVESDRLGLIGVSKGANAALCVAADERRVMAIVADSTFPTTAMQKCYMRRFMRIFIRSRRFASNIPDACLVSFCEWARYLLGVRENCRIVRLDQKMKKIRQPVFMIHGERDSYVPLEVAQVLRAYMPGRSKHWIVPGANHNGAVSTEATEYRRRISRFFRRRLHAESS